MNGERLRDEMKKRGVSCQNMCNMLGMCRSAFYRKCNGISEFTQGEIQKIVDYLDLDSPVGIFLIQKCPKRHSWIINHTGDPGCPGAAWGAVRRCVRMQIQSVRVIPVIEIKIAAGSGTEDDPNRIVTEYWSEEGKMLHLKLNDQPVGGGAEHTLTMEEFMRGPHMFLGEL